MQGHRLIDGRENSMGSSLVRDRQSAVKIESLSWLETGSREKWRSSLIIDRQAAEKM
jgi:hypothetical protein